MLKGVQEHPPKGIQGAFRAIAWHRLFGQPVESAKIIEAGHMIGMVMREKHGVDAIDLVGDALQPQFGSSIDENVKFFVANEYARPRAFVARIVGCTHLTIAADHGHAVRRAGAEDDDFKIRHSVHPWTRRQRSIIRQENAHDQLCNLPVARSPTILMNEENSRITPIIEIAS